MPPGDVTAIPPDILERFARKGAEDGGPAPPTAGPDNGLKVRRVVQLVEDLSGKPVDQLSILDLGCGEGVYAIELALRGARVHALDGRTERMRDGEAIARRLGLESIHFEQADVRRVNWEEHAHHDVVLLLGLLYHLDAPDACRLLMRIGRVCRGLLIIDTRIALRTTAHVAFGDGRYGGQRIREHDDADSPEVRQRRVMGSLDNTHAFLFTRRSLVDLLVNAGYTTVLECAAPLEPFKPADRVTLTALKRQPAAISTYPWVNGKSEAEIHAVLAARRLLVAEHRAAGAVSRAAGAVSRAVNRALRPVGIEIRRHRPDS